MLFLTLLLILLILPATVQARTFSYTNAPVRQVIAEIEAATAYRFLFRDALVSRKTVSFTAGETDVLAKFDAALQAHRLKLVVNESRRQVLVVESKEETKAVISGVVVDAESGARLPFATVTWRHKGRVDGVAANETGTFLLPLDRLPDTSALTLTASYVGYHARSVGLDPKALPASLPFRLQPQSVRAPEVVVSSALLFTDLDTTWHHLTRAGTRSPLGESSIQRALQALPSVSLTPALSSGLIVRGSRADGFQILLDGMTVYNQQHFFGLFDAFNEDALQTVGLYYGVAPASFQAPPGGTLSFLTRTGSLSGVRASAGVSNTAARATVEGPFGDGRGSWLLAGRHSFVDQINWFNNDALIAQGLGVGRETSATRERSVLVPTATTARFYDLHGKVAWEAATGDRFTFSTYLGGDHTTVDTRPRRDLETDRTFTTENRWGNETASFHYQKLLGQRTFAHAFAGVSRYHSFFSRDDYLYLRPGPATDAPQHRLAPYAYDNELTERKLAVQTDLVPASGGLLATGATVSLFDQSYSETSILRQDFDGERSAAQLDLFASYEMPSAGWGTASAGLRTHFFSAGNFFRLSPRLHVRLWPEGAGSVGAGYSRNYQFLHRLSLETTTATDIWVLSSAAEPPGSVDHLTAGLYLKPAPAFSVQIEGYWKGYENLRQHQLDVGPRPTREGSFLLAPWLHDTRAQARGVEAMARLALGRVLWTKAYTLSRTTLEHPAINDGEAFRADWDRTHQFSTHLQYRLGGGADFFASWLWASGTPNRLAFSNPGEPATLGPYHRLDLGFRYQHTFGRATLEAQVSLFNAYDRANTWYRAPLVELVAGQQQPRVGRAIVDVYDLGFQPSFSLTIRR